MLRTPSGPHGRDRLPTDGARRRLAAAGLAFGLIALPGLLTAPAAMADETTATAPSEGTADAAVHPEGEGIVAEPAEPVVEEPAPVAEEPAPVAEEPAPAPAPVAEEPAPVTEAPAEEPSAPAEPTDPAAPVDQPEVPADGEAAPEETPVDAPADPADPAAEVPAGVLTVAEPTPGSTVDPTTLLFAGTGVTALDVITITYENEDGETVNATSPALPVLVGADLTWATPASFSEAAEEEVAVTVTETNVLTGETAGDPVTLTITIGEPSTPAFPFAVTTPAEGDTIDSYTPTLAGTAGPSEVVVVTVTGPHDAQPVIAGGGVASDTGAFTTVLDLGKVKQDDDGETDVTIQVTRLGADGTLVPDNLRSVDVTFAPDDAPFVPNAPAILLMPDRITVSEATDPLKGVRVSATGFRQNEDVEITLVDPNGATILFDEQALEVLGGSDETGTFEAPLFLFGQPALGAYSVTVTGVDSDLALTGSFELIADPVAAPTVPSAPSVPADTGVTPIDNPVDHEDTDADYSGTDELAYTGSSTLPVTGLAAALLLAGGALVLLRRRVGITAR
ncbi:LPXTG cell wall anchor domain-containing protein [Planctomonas deserti]|uniref:LPXTG cell wall anchor domain-containing protein n=1 Tax=Planctomonas deserti TaxID=2144185 RepID=UPI000D3700AD|nr:LPXTG cell wall anchor domain-containing protein [Planctomonas deserti]